MVVVRGASCTIVGLFFLSMMLSLQVARATPSGLGEMNMMGFHPHCGEGAGAKHNLPANDAQCKACLGHKARLDFHQHHADGLGGTFCRTEEIPASEGIR